MWNIPSPLSPGVPGGRIPTSPQLCTDLPISTAGWCWVLCPCRQPWRRPVSVGGLVWSPFLSSPELLTEITPAALVPALLCKTSETFYDSACPCCMGAALSEISRPPSGRAPGFPGSEPFSQDPPGPLTSLSSSWSVLQLPFPLTSVLR